MKTIRNLMIGIGIAGAVNYGTYKLAEHQTKYAELYYGKDWAVEYAKQGLNEPLVFYPITRGSSLWFEKYLKEKFSY